MEAEPIGGGILGLAFGEVKDTVKDFVKRTMEFKSVLLKLQATLDFLEPFFVKIARKDSDQIRSQELAKQLLDILNEIKPAVAKCRDNKLRFWKKAKYTKKLQDLDMKLLEIVQLNVEAILMLSLDTRGSLEKRDDLTRKIDDMMELFPNREPLQPPELPDHEIIGLEKPIADLKKMVFDDDSCGPVVITALPGSGKTTLATMFCHDPQIKEKFGKNIFFTTVSSKPEIEYLEKLANMIKETEEVRDILLVLDDVWPNEENDIIKLFVSEKPKGYKILVTSRFQFQNLKKSSFYELGKLSEKDAEAVFCDAAKPDPELDVDDLVKTIVNRCRASPLALKVIGASLKGKSMASWAAKLHEWSKGGWVNDSKVHDDVKDILDSLNAKQKECYLDLGSFPKDQWIPASALRDIWVEKYGHDEAGATTLHFLYQLSTRNLINFKLCRKDMDGIEGSSNDYYVQLHDLIRDLAIHSSSRDPVGERTRLIANLQENEFPDWWAQQKNLDKADLLSISTDEKFSSTWETLNTPKVKVLVLNSRTNYTFPDFLNKMDRLRVIVITNYGFSHAQLLNTKVLTKLPNLTRIRFERFFITSIPKMANLKKLSLVMCEFGDTFADHTSDMANILPKLVEFEIHQPSGLKKLPNGLCNITGLKRLSITYCEDLVELPEELGRLTNLEALRLHSCMDLKELPDSLCDLQNLKHLDITNCYAMDKLPERMGELDSLESLHMKLCGGSWGLKDLPTSVKNLKSLKKVLCSEETYPKWKNVEGNITSLKSILVPEEDLERSIFGITGKHE